MSAAPAWTTFADVAQRLEVRLVQRHRTAGYLDEVALPRATALGVVDVLRPGRDPDADRRARANVHVTPHAALIGPWSTDTGQPDACGVCLAGRWQWLRSKPQLEAFDGGAPVFSPGGWPILTDHVVDAVWACYEARFAPGASPSQGRPRSHVSRVDLHTLTVSELPIFAMPGCPGCAALRPSNVEVRRRGLELRSQRKPDPDTYRLREPSAYELPTLALANPVTGVIGPSAAPIVTSPTMAPVLGGTVMRGSAGLFDVTWSGQSHSYASSRDLALLEGLERYAGTQPRGQVEVVVDTYDNLGDDALDPRECGVYAERTYATDHQVSPFTPQRPIPWVWGYSLRDQRPILVPKRISYYSSGSTEDDFVFECSNGCASGGSLEEAILFGLLELIERDAFLLGWYGGTSLTRVDLPDDVPTTIRSMIDRAGLLGYEVHLFDNRIDLPIPVVTGVAIRHDRGPGLLSFASAASFDPYQAVSGALCEILTYIPSLRRQVVNRRAELEAMVGDFSLVHGIRDHATLFGLPEMERHARHYLDEGKHVDLTDAYTGWERLRPRTGDLLDDLTFARDLVVDAGLDVIVVDQTAPEQAAFGLNSACVIVPGLLPIDFGWERQRALHMPRMFAARRPGTPALTPERLHRVPHPFP